MTSPTLDRSGSVTLAERIARRMNPETSRRSFLRKAAMVATALATAPVNFILRPGTAYAAVCGPAPACNQGYTVLCCTVNRGINACPPGMFVGGWWKANGSTLCCDSAGRPTSRYYIDCHPTCTCDSGGSRNFCDPACVACKCRCNNDSGTCDQRRVCCNYFRYGQCNTQIARSGPVACRVVTCTPPYVLWDECSATVRTDDYTAEQTAPCVAGPCA